MAENESDKKVDRLIAGLFMTFTTTIGLLSGFGFSVAQAKKKDTKGFLKGLEPQKEDPLESGVRLARRALARATLYSVGGFSLFCFSIWKLSGAQNFEEFRYKAGNFLPRIKRNSDQPQGRTEFKNLTELFQYLIDESEKENQIKKLKNKDINKQE